VDSGVADASGQSSREETPESDGSGSSNHAGAVVVTTSVSSKVFQEQPLSPPASMPMPGRVPNLRPSAQANPLMQEMRARQQQQQQQQTTTRAQNLQSPPASSVAPYVNIPAYGEKMHSPPAYNVVVQQQQQQQQQQPVLSPADTLADQLKRGLEERRRNSKDNGVPTPVANVERRHDRVLAANMEQAVRVANETGKS